MGQLLQWLIQVSVVLIIILGNEQYIAATSESDGHQEDEVRSQSAPLEIRIGFLVARQRRAGGGGGQRTTSYSTRPGRLMSHVFSFAIDKINSLYGTTNEHAPAACDEIVGAGGGGVGGVGGQHFESRGDLTSTTRGASDSPTRQRARTRGVVVEVESSAPEEKKTGGQFMHNNDNNNDSNDIERVNQQSSISISGSQIDDRHNHHDVKRVSLKVQRQVRHIMGVASTQQEVGHGMGEIILNSNNVSHIDHHHYNCDLKKLISFKAYIMETFGEESESIRQTVELILSKRVHVIVGPQETCQVEPLIASIYDVPMISHYCSQYTTAPAAALRSGGGKETHHHHHHDQRQSVSPPLVLANSLQSATMLLLARGQQQQQQQPVQQQPKPFGTFIQTKPPIWKIVRRVVALVRKLLRSAEVTDYYPQQLVLLYYNELPPPPAATTTTSHASARARATSGKNDNNNNNNNNNKLQPQPQQRQQRRHAPQVVDARQSIGSNDNAPEQQQLRNDVGAAAAAAVNHSSVATSNSNQQQQRPVSIVTSGEVDYATSDPDDDDDGLALDSLLLNSMPNLLLTAADGSSQYKLIGKLLEIKLASLLREHQERLSARALIAKRHKQNHARQDSTSNHNSLTVLNWHTTFHYGYVRNPFRNIIRRHLFRERQRQAQSVPDVMSLFNQSGSNDNNAAAAAALLQLRRQQCASDGSVLLRNTETASAAADKSRRTADKVNHKAPQSVLRSTESIYIVVGHHYEHLGLMLALDELGLLDDNADGVDVESTGAGGADDSTTDQQHSDKDEDDDERQTLRPVKRKRRQRQPSIVVGVDIEPHDERDDSVRFLRGLLMDGGGNAMLGSTASLAPPPLHSNSKISMATSENGSTNNDHNEHQQQQQQQQQRAFYDLNSLALRYNNYIAVSPAKPRRSIELLDEMRQFYNTTTAGDKHQQQQQQHLPDLTLATTSQSRSTTSTNSTTTFSIYDSNLLALKMLQFARLPIEAYYLYDSLMLIGAYYNECLNSSGGQVNNSARQLIAECASGVRMARWFANRHYSSHINGPSERGEPAHATVSKFDSRARAEGSYSLLARRLPQLRTAGQAPSLHLPLDSSWQDDEFDIVPVGYFGASTNVDLNKQIHEDDIQFIVEPTSVARVWLPLWCESAADANASRECVDYFDQRANASQTRWDDDDHHDHHDDALNDVAVQANSKQFVLYLVIGSIIIVLILIALKFTLFTNASHTRGGRLANCLSTSDNDDDDEATNWFSTQDARNFLHIVHKLLLMPDTLINEAHDVDDYDGEDENDYDDDSIDGGKSAFNLATTMSADLLTNDDDDDDDDDGNWPIRRRVKCGGGVASIQRQLNNFDADDGIALVESKQKQWQLERRQQMVASSCAIDLHCYMFPFPSCKFVHWLLALYKLKEMLFKYQSNLSGGLSHGTTAMASISKATSRARSLFCLGSLRSNGGRLMFQLPILFEAKMSAASKEISANNIESDDDDVMASASTYVNGGGGGGGVRVKMNRFKMEKNVTGGGSATRRYQPFVRSTNKLDEMRNDDDDDDDDDDGRNEKRGAINNTSHQRCSFFSARHKHSAMLRLLLNKYKLTNERLCELASLRHVNVVKLLGITLLTTGYTSQQLECASAAATTTPMSKLAQLLVERTERGSLRQELETLRADVHMNASCCLVDGGDHHHHHHHRRRRRRCWRHRRKCFMPALWRSLCHDLLAGLEYLHEQQPAIGFHGELNATNCLLTSTWRLKLSGFHVSHMRRSFGYYEMCSQTQKTTATSNFIDTSVYLAPEILMNGASVNGNAVSGGAASTTNCTNKSPGGNGQLLSTRDMQLADIYSCAFVIYELLVGREPWSCLDDELKQRAQQPPAQVAFKQSNDCNINSMLAPNAKLLVERVKVDSSFRPPMWRLDDIMPILNRAQSRRNVAAHGNAEELVDLVQDEVDEHLRGVAVFPSNSAKLSTTARQVTSANSNHSTNRRRLTGGDKLCRLIELCWSHSAKLRPRSVRSLRAQLAHATAGRLVGASVTSRDYHHDQELHLSKLYTKLVERSARERKLALVRERAKRAELASSLLPRTVRCARELRDANSTTTITQQFDCVHLCLFKFFLLPNNATNPAPIADILNGILSQLDKLIDSYQGHIHMWDSQVDSMLRFMTCTSTDLAPHDITKSKRSLDSTAINSARLLATFAFELIDLTNDWQFHRDGQIQVKCALHLGQAQGHWLASSSVAGGDDDSMAIPATARGNIPRALRLARFILSGPALQVADWLDQMGQPQRIHISHEFKACLLADQSQSETPSTSAFDLANLLPKIISGAGDTSSTGNDSQLNQRQSYVILKRNGNSDFETFWLLNGPRVTLSQRLTLPLIGNKSES